MCGFRGKEGWDGRNGGYRGKTTDKSKNSAYRRRDDWPLNLSGEGGKITTLFWNIDCFFMFSASECFDV